MARLLRFAAALLIATLTLDGAPADAPIVIKFSHGAAEDSPKGKAAEYFRKLAEARTRGRVRVEIFPGYLLYGERDELEAVQLGAVQMLAAPLANFSAVGVRDFEVFELPYLFDGLAAVHRVTEGPAGAALLAQLDAKGMHGLGYWDFGFKEFSANRALRAPADAKGLRLRVKYSRVSDAQMRALGATPQATSVVDMYPGLRNGTLDGTESPAPLIRGERLDEVQRFLTVSDHAYVGSALVVNTKFWRRLPRDIRDALEGAAREATRYANELARKDNEDAIEAMRRGDRITVVTLSPAEKAQWKHALIGVHRDSERRIAPEVLSLVYDGAGFTPE